MNFKNYLPILSTYSPDCVLTLIKSPSFIKRGTLIVRSEQQEFQRRKREVLARPQVTERRDPSVLDRETYRARSERVRPVRLQAREKVMEMPPAISLKEAVEKRFVSHGSRKEREVFKVKTNPDIAGLREILADTPPQNDVKIEIPKSKKGILKPGEGIKFD